MTSERFKDEIDHLDSGLSDHPDTSTYKREGRAVRRRRQGIVALGAGALVAAVVTPAVMWGGGTAKTGPSGQVAEDPTSVESNQPATPVPVDASFGQGVRAAVAERFPGANFVGQELGDHYEDDGVGLRPVVSSPPNWANVFTWRQDYELDGLQFFDTRSSWESDAGNLAWCSAGSFEVEKDCTVTVADGYTVVAHDGVRLQGEPEGDWTRAVQVVAPVSEGGRTQFSEVWAQVEGMTWAQADAALPTVEELKALATDERLRLPEPTEMVEVR